MEENRNEEIVQEKPKKLTLNQKRKILKEAEIVIVNNHGGFLFYRDDTLGVEIELPGYGDTDFVEAEVLRRMNMKSKGFFEKYWILVADFSCDDDRIELEDVYEYLGISKYYKDMTELPDGEFFDNLLLNTSNKNFRKFIEKINNKLMTRLCARAVELYKKGKFESSNKIQAIEERIGREGYFLDVKPEE